MCEVLAPKFVGSVPGRVGMSDGNRQVKRFSGGDVGSHRSQVIDLWLVKEPYTHDRDVKLSKICVGPFTPVGTITSVGPLARVPVDQGGLQNSVITGANFVLSPCMGESCHQEESLTIKKKKKIQNYEVNHTRNN